MAMSRHRSGFPEVLNRVSLHALDSISIHGWTCSLCLGHTEPDANGDCSGSRNAALEAAAPTVQNQKEFTAQPMKYLKLAAILFLGGGIFFLTASTLRQATTFYYSPGEVLDGKAASKANFRLGGRVRDGSLRRAEAGWQFILTDDQAEITVNYTGELPDLFGQGRVAIANGSLNDEGIFLATELLARHDENYLPPER